MSHPLRPGCVWSYNQGMNYNNDDDLSSFTEEEVGSDELLASDNLHLPAGANVLVRLHATRAWLNRRYEEAGLEVGKAALAMQMAARSLEGDARPRRRSLESNQPVQQAQRAFVAAQRRQTGYEEARELLEDCVAHTTPGERLLVEYYLALEARLHAFDSPTDTSWIEAMQDAMHRVEQIGTPAEDDE